MDDRFIVATDTGGTFVDAVIWNGKGNSFIGKSPSTPDNPPEGVLSAIEVAAQNAGLTLDDVLANAEMMNNGTTVTTNAMIERKGATAGLLTTIGFEDTLVIERVIGRTIGLDENQLYDFKNAEPPVPVVPLERVRGAIERVDSWGKVVIPLDEKSVEIAISELVAEGTEVLAICFLWSFLNSHHETRAAEIAKALYPGLFVVTSSELVPVIREYERANTTSINAFLGPVFQRYAEGIRYELSEAGYKNEPLIMQSIGGLAPAKEIERTPINTLFSGPVGGVIASQKIGSAMGESNLITTDMGGTSFDVGIILDGNPLIAPQTVIERQLVAIPTVEVVTVGAGGGSAATVSELGTLNVGPQSMGSQPGPACYARNGETPTVTDADVILGYIDPEHFLGGTMQISKELAIAAMEAKVAKPLGIDVTQAAAGVYQIVNARMADLIRRVTVERGHDPRDFSIVAFGGCGPTHCTAYGPDIGVKKVIVPLDATVFSALGIGQSEFRHSLVHSVPRELRKLGGIIAVELKDEINDVLSTMERRCRILIANDGGDLSSTQVVFSADLRYQNQIHELTVAIPHRVPLSEEALRGLVHSFEELYDSRYGSGASSPSSLIELINLRIDSTAPTSIARRTGRSKSLAGGPERAFLDTKPIYSLATRQFEPTPLYKAELLCAGDIIKGRALIVSYGMTIPLHDGQTMSIEGDGSQLVITF